MHGRERRRHPGRNRPQLRDEPPGDQSPTGWSPGAFLFSASQDGRCIEPDVLQFPGLKCLTFFRCSGADVPQLPAVRALAGFSRSFHFKVAVVADKYHFLHAPSFLDSIPPNTRPFNPLCHFPRFIQYMVYITSNCRPTVLKKAWPPTVKPTVKTTKAKTLNSPGERPRLQGALPGCFAFQLKEVSSTEQNAAFRFTDEEMEIAKNTDLPDLLEHLGYRLQRIGRYYTTREMDSIRVKDRRTWKRYSNGTGGDAITFLQTFEGKDFRESVEYLLDLNGRFWDSSLPRRLRPPPRKKIGPSSPCPRPMMITAGCSPASSQSPLHFVSACGENCVRSLAPPFPIEPASLGFDGSPFSSAGLRLR